MPRRTLVLVLVKRLMDAGHSLEDMNSAFQAIKTPPPDFQDLESVVGKSMYLAVDGLEIPIEEFKVNESFYPFDYDEDSNNSVRADKTSISDDLDKSVPLDTSAFLLRCCFE
ncbi:hypothetical protein CDAR_582061 [Caerostris darwini]|uniref:Uncharacterized protein n=1 Tax=Caerostris darwini TaxID=1538125 RepID=A0AAV4X8W5_9ARAC|nr:hypothetical protein CDAR_582061 [Caerostris darwini]